MSATKIATPVVLVSMIVVAGLAAWMAALEPARMWAAAIAAGFLPGAWLALSAVGRFAPARSCRPAASRLVRVSMISAALVLAVSLAGEIGQVTGFIPAGRWDIEELVFGFALVVATLAIGWAARKANQDS